MKFGQPEERKRLLARWQQMGKSTRSCARK